MVAIIKACKCMAKDFPVPKLPAWITEPRMTCVAPETEMGEDGVGNVLKQARELVGPLATLEKAVWAHVDRIVGVRSAGVGASEERCSEYDACSVNVPLVCLSRLLLGACCEAYLTYKCSLITLPGNMGNMQNTKVMAELCKDACRVAVWTSAHASYLHDLICHNGISPSPPSIHSVPNQFTEFDLSDLYARRHYPKALRTQDSAYLLSVITRCTNPGSRGWDNAVHSSLTKSDSTRRICANGLIVSITGMNSCIHPAIRLHWTKRLQLVNSMLVRFASCDMLTFAKKCMVEFKEMARRMVSNCTSSAFATAAALNYMEHPVALLEPCPVGLPCLGLQASCTAFALAGKAFVESRCKKDISACVLDAFNAQSEPVDKAEGTEYLLWNPSYLGKRTLPK